MIENQMHHRHLTIMHSADKQKGTITFLSNAFSHVMRTFNLWEAVDNDTVEKADQDFSTR